MQALEAVRRPYVKFEHRAVEDREASIKNGYYSTKDVVFILIVPHGSEGKSKLEYVYSEWLSNIKNSGATHNQHDGDLISSQARFPAEWLDAIEKSHAAWLKGETLEVSGTPLKTWPVLSPAQRQNCNSLHIFTVEELAGTSDDVAQSLGMGGINLRQRARDWLLVMNAAPGKASAEMDRLRADAEASKTRTASLEAQLTALQAQIAQLTKK
jgi:hypothetical protein